MKIYLKKVPFYQISKSLFEIKYRGLLILGIYTTYNDTKIPDNEG